MPVSPEKRRDLEQALSAAGIREEDLGEQFVTGSGKGGQKQNKTASCVVLKHEPSGIVVKSQKTRSREDNRFFARRALLEQFQSKEKGVKSPSEKKADKIRKQKKRRKRRSEQAE